MRSRSPAGMPARMSACGGAMSSGRGGGVATAPVVSACFSLSAGALRAAMDCVSAGFGFVAADLAFALASALASALAGRASGTAFGSGTSLCGSRTVWRRRWCFGLALASFLASFDAAPVVKIRSNMPARAAGALRPKAGAKKASTNRIGTRRIDTSTPRLRWTRSMLVHRRAGAKPPGPRPRLVSRASPVLRLCHARPIRTRTLRPPHRPA